VRKKVGGYRGEEGKNAKPCNHWKKNTGDKLLVANLKKTNSKRWGRGPTGGEMSFNRRTCTQRKRAVRGGKTGRSTPTNRGGNVVGKGAKRGKGGLLG